MKCDMCSTGYVLENEIINSCIRKSQLNCLDDEFEALGSCVKTCPNGTYPHALAKKCRFCSYECETCIDYNKCLTCRVGLTLDVSTKECFNCQNGCLDCSHRYTCVECHPAFTL